MYQSTRPRPRAVRVKNAVCPRCDGPVYFRPDRWLFCTGCPRRPAASARAIPFALAGPAAA